MIEVAARSPGNGRRRGFVYAAAPTNNCSSDTSAQGNPVHIHGISDHVSIVASGRPIRRARAHRTVGGSTGPHRQRSVTLPEN